MNTPSRRTGHLEDLGWPSPEAYPPIRHSRRQTHEVSTLPRVGVEIKTSSKKSCAAALVNTDAIPSLTTLPCALVATAKRGSDDKYGVD